ncbi:MAG: stage II sporulation protein M [Candidatus Pacearchaeota archaeon]
MAKLNRNKRKDSWLTENYSKSWKFIKESRKFIYSIIAVFFAFALFGFFIPAPESIAQEIMRILEQILRETEGLSQFELIRFIFLNNIQSSFFGVFLGVFLGIFPIFFAVFNGYVLGFVADIAVDAGGFGVLWRLLPHGIFELPAIFISLGMGVRFGISVLKIRNIKTLKEHLYDLVRAFVLVVLPLLIIAALIEGSLIALGR